MKKSGPYSFEGMKPSPISSGSDDSQPVAGPAAGSGSGSGSSSKRRPRSRSPPRPHGGPKKGDGEGSSSSSVVWDTMVKRSSPVRKKKGAGSGGGHGGGGVLHVSLDWSSLFSEADKQSKLRMGVKLLALVAFSPLFLAKACIDAVSSLNQYLLDYLPGIVDAVYTWLVLPVSKAGYRAARLVSGAVHAVVLRPALAVARWWWALLVPPVAAAFWWLWGGICAVPGWAWAQACAAYLVLRHRLLPSLHRKLTEGVWPWVQRRVVRPVWEAYVALFRWSYGTLHLHVLAPVQRAAGRAVGGVTGQCRRAVGGVVGAAKGALQFARDGCEVAWLCVGMLVLGRSPAAEAAGAGDKEE